MPNKQKPKHTHKYTTQSIPNHCLQSLPAHHQHIYTHLYSLLENLFGVEQSPRYHPEGDALYHSLQVFECSLAESTNPNLWAAALLHDVGKAINYPNHAETGADELEGLLHPYICWLIRHHLDLLTHPQKTRKRLAGSVDLTHLELLRKWDLQGRKTHVEVIDIPEALDMLVPHFPVICLNIK